MPKVNHYHYPHAESRAIEERDIAAGDFTYGERIEMLRIFRNDELSDYEKTKQVIKLLHDITLEPQELAFYAPYCVKVVQGLNEWLTREQSECYVPPTDDMIAAGVDKLSADIGEMGGVVSLAEARGWSFEQVLKLPYMEVFAIWKVEAAREKYYRRYDQVIKNKSKHG